MELEAVTVLLNAEVLLRLGVAFLLGGIIGFERQMHGRPAGLRTHILVCVGSAVVMIAAKSQPSFYALAPDVHMTIDPGRIVAGIMTGIGFLGAGAIVRTGDFVRGLTTAACIWLVA
ncbi:MAG TPA: MgtC/SapB family protein, partial [Thermodesulfobacteriota bacterium]|nr:MgtC/SapB family protein [Thermodesulfobacteriota bacterium]